MKLFTYLVSVAHDGKSIETLTSWIHIRVVVHGCFVGSYLLEAKDEARNNVKETLRTKHGKMRSINER